MIDWHCHILPGMDDGSRDVSESIEMIRKQASDGIKTVIATPHFYANDESVDSFLERRNGSLHILKSELGAGSPKIIPGAEVRYYPGISRMENLNKLRISGTKLLLLEMPMTAWTDSMIKELLVLSGKSGISIVLAHIDRYFGLQKSHIWEKLSRDGVLMQVNSECFDRFFSKRKAMSLLENGVIQFVGSDCHNLTSRPPCVANAYDIIRNKLGEEFVSQMNGYGCSLLELTVIKT